MKEKIVVDLKSQLRDYILRNFLFGDREIFYSDSDSFMEKSIIDSTGILEIIIFVENNYNIKIKDEEILPENLDSIDNLTNFINRKVKEGSKVA